MENLNIFTGNYLPENFFNIFITPKKEFYINFLYTVYRDLEASSLSFKIKKSEFWDKMSRYITLNPNLIKRVCDSADTIFGDESVKRNFIINTTAAYIDDQWLEETYDISGDKYLSLLPHTISFLSWLADIRNDDKPFLSGVISSIKHDLLSDDLTYETLQNLKRTCRSFKSDLLNLSTGMKKLIAGFLNNKTLTDYVTVLLSNLQSAYFMDYKKLKSDENISRYRYEIEDRLYSLATDEELILTNIVSNYMSGQKDRFAESDFELETQKTYSDLIKLTSDLYDFFKKTYDELISTIESERLKYWRIATEQIEIARKHGESELAQVQTIIAKSSESQNDLSHLFDLSAVSYVDQECLRKKVSKPREKCVHTIKRTKLTDGERKSLSSQVLKTDSERFSAEVINTFIESAILDKPLIKISNIPVKSRDDLTLLGYVPIYYNKEKFSIVSHDDYYTTKFGEIKNYTIINKEKTK